MPDAINLAGEEREMAAHGRRKRSAATGNGRRTLALTNKKRGLAASTSARDHQTVTQRCLAVRDERRRPVVVLLGGEEWELERAKLLCEKLGQRRLYTSLVWGATHVVVGSSLTLERKSSGSSGGVDVSRGGDGGGDGVVDEEDGRGVRHELVSTTQRGISRRCCLASGCWTSLGCRRAWMRGKGPSTAARRANPVTVRA